MMFQSTIASVASLVLKNVIYVFQSLWKREKTPFQVPTKFVTYVLPLLICLVLVIR